MVELRAIEPGEPAGPPTRMAGTASPPPPATAPALAPLPAPGTIRLYLQLGSFISRDNAESLRAQLALNDVGEASVLESRVDRQNIYRVRIGPLSSVEEADRLAIRIDGLGIGVPSIVID
jgi:rare lipoprotein A